MRLGEFRRHWPALLGASLGLALGLPLNQYTMSLFGPALIAEFGWSRADFALLGMVSIISMLFFPFAGRFIDRVGVRPAAMIGFVAMPLGFVTFTMMNGDIFVFFAIYLVQHIFGILTSTIAFCRVAVERFNTARGIALSVIMTAPPVLAALATPFLGGLIDSEGWRAGYYVLALASGLGGVVAILLMGRSEREPDTHIEGMKISLPEIVQIVRNPVFLLMMTGMFLVNVPQAFASSQMKLVVMDGGVTSLIATWLVSAYAAGNIFGRVLCGVALDRVPPHYVALATLGLPAIGYLLLAAYVTATPLLIFSLLLIGLAQGAEGDIGAYMISKRFDLKNFSLLLSALQTMVAFGGVAGAFIMTTTLRATDHYQIFLLSSAAATVLGAMLFVMTGGPFGRRPIVADASAIARTGQ